MKRNQGVVDGAEKAAGVAALLLSTDDSRLDEDCGRSGSAAPTEPCDDLSRLSDDSEESLFPPGGKGQTIRPGGDKRRVPRQQGVVSAAAAAKAMANKAAARGGRKPRRVCGEERRRGCRRRGDAVESENSALGEHGSYNSASSLRR